MNSKNEKKLTFIKTNETLQTLRLNSLRALNETIAPSPIVKAPTPVKLI
jgi:hypothetical protein